MTKERDLNMKLIVNENVDISPNKISTEPVEDNVYQSDPIKTDLYSKLLAFRQSQKKFNVNDLIHDRLK